MFTLENNKLTLCQAEAPSITRFTTILKGEAILVYCTRTPNSLRLLNIGTGITTTLIYGDITWVSGFVADNQLHIYYRVNTGEVTLMTLTELGQAPVEYPVVTAPYSPITFSVMKAGNHYYAAFDTGSTLDVIQASDRLFANKLITRQVFVSTANVSYRLPVLGCDPAYLKDGLLSKVTLGLEKRETSSPTKTVFYLIPFDTTLD